MGREEVWYGVGMGEHFFGNPLLGIIKVIQMCSASVHMLDVVNLNNNILKLYQRTNIVSYQLLLLNLFKPI